MTYVVKEAFLTLQGEGANTGRTAVFCRFTGCNLWSGREEDRGWATCRFCDTDFVGTNGLNGGRFATPHVLVAHLSSIWGPSRRHRLVVCTGGEPLLQLDDALIDALHGEGFQVAVETNGTVAAPSGVDWICVSPKAGTNVVQRRGHELKLVYPQDGAQPSAFEGWDFEHFFLQPMDGPRRGDNTAEAIHYCLTHPQWRLSLQTHKVTGIL